VSKPFIDIKSIPQLCKVLGLPKSHAVRLEIRRDLVVAIHAKIKAKKLTHEKAAELTGVGRTVITAILNGNIAKISTDRLIDIADRLGLDLQLRVA
jgi:predicted XRE-type DNA-binding protein